MELTEQAFFNSKYTCFTLEFALIFRPINHESPKAPLYTTPAPVPHPVHAPQAPTAYTPVSTLRPDYTPHPQSHGYHPAPHDPYQPAHQGTIH